MKTLSVDVAVLGFGTAGMNAYRSAAKHTKNIVVVQHGLYGTTCARVGCMPSKLLIASADSAFSLEEAPSFGIFPGGDTKIYGHQVLERVRSLRDAFVGHVVSNVEKIPQEQRISGKARFINDHEILVDNHTKVQAKTFVIATGSDPRFLPQAEILGDRHVVNDDIFEWERLPESVAVFGTGVIGMELGQALKRLGVRVSLFGRSGNVAAFTDPEIQEKAKDLFHRELDVFPGATIQEMKREGDRVHITFTDVKGVEYEKQFEYVLSAIGRVPNIADLELQNTSLKLSEKGIPVFDSETMQCGESNIFIAGDVNGNRALLHEASDEGDIAGENAALFPNVSKGDRRVPLSVVFTDPEMGSCGTPFGELEKGIFVIGKIDFSDQGRSKVINKNKGMLHVYAEKKTGRILGAEMIGPHAEHLLHLLAWSIGFSATASDLLKMPFYHPTVEEGVRTALRDIEKQRK